MRSRFEDKSVRDTMSKGTHRPREALSKGLVVQGPHRPMDASSKGSIF